MILTADLLSSVTELLLVFAISLIFYYYVYYKYCFTYWKKKKVPYFPPTFPVGNLSKAAFGIESVFVRLQNLHQEFKKQGHRFGGIYFLNGPIYMPVDPDLVKSVLISDFEYFVDRGMYLDEEKVPLSSHIFSMTGDRWRNIRTKMTPVFTSGKMKSMYNILVKNYENLVEFLTPKAENEEIIDIKDTLMRLTSDIIGSTAFGIDCNSLRFPEIEFSRMVRQIFNHPPWKLLKLLIEEGVQNPGNIIKIAEDNKFLENYFTNLVRKTVEYRDKNNVVRDDFLNVLMQLRKTGMEFKEVVSQAFLFFTAGYETSSSTMSYCLHELTYNQDLQDKLRQELHTKLGKNCAKYTYDDIMNLPSLDKVVKETLRKYPPVAMLNRICVKPYTVPGTDVVIEKGTPVIISVFGLHRDEDYFPDPLAFDPERFNGETKIEPFTYLPFGDGPRNCIGLRFGLMQTKLGLATLLNGFKFLPCEKSTRHLTIDPSTTTIVLGILGSVNVKIVKL